MVREDVEEVIDLHEEQMIRSWDLKETLSPILEREAVKEVAKEVAKEAVVVLVADMELEVAEEIDPITDAMVKVLAVVGELLLPLLPLLPSKQ